MTYSRKIAYFDLLEEGQKKGNAGFCKWEQRNGRHRLVFSLNGIPKAVSKNVPLYTSLGKELGKMQVLEGRGECVCSLQDGDERRKELARIFIPLSESLELTAEFPGVSDKEELAELSGELDKEESAEEVFAKRIKTDQLVVKEGAQEKEETDPQTERVSFAEREEEVPLTGKHFTEGAAPKSLTEAEELPPEPTENWKQKEMIPVSFAECLEKHYQKVYPFGTDEMYFKIAVKDIYGLKKEYQMLRNNQFLLHGYYNYHYLILGKKSPGESAYWLGVPGIYHEREKMAARMYGFEKFEGAKPGYRTGDLGYYLITAEI